MIRNQTDPALQRLKALKLSPPDNLQQQSFVVGRYSEIHVVGDLIVKSNSIGDCSSPESQSTRLVDRKNSVELYYENLKDIRVNMPEMEISLGETIAGLPALIVTAEKISAPNNFIQLPTASASEQTKLIAGMLQELLKVVDTHHTATPIGYDSGFDNFVSHDDKCYLIDIYPPRLGFKRSEDGSVEKLGFSELLINYPEKDNLSPERQNLMRRYYYTPEGAMEHFTTWAIATVFSTDTDCSWEKIKNTAGVSAVKDVIFSTLSTAGKGVLVDHIKSYLNSSSGQQEISYRMPRNAQRYAVLIEQWRNTCHLF